MSTFADAFHVATQASIEYRVTCEDRDASSYDVDLMAERLAQAGDVLESELRQMIRKEVEASDYIGWADPTTCPHSFTRSGGLGKPDICERCGDEL